MNKKRALREIMDKKTVHAIGAYDAFSAILIEKHSFDAVYLSSWLVGASNGKPDLSLIPLTEILRLSRNMARAVKIPVIVDMEQGFGNAIHMIDAVERLEETGVSGMHIDDLVPPGKCPYIKGMRRSRVVTVEEMCGKIKAAVETRNDPNFLVIARSDIVGTVPVEQFKKEKEKLYEEVLRRCKAYAKAGADAVFPYGIFTIKDCEYFVKSIKTPLVTLVSYAQPLPFIGLKKLGFKIVITVPATFLSAAKGMMEGLRALKEANEDWMTAVQKNAFVKGSEILEMININKYKDYYKKYNVP